MRGLSAAVVLSLLLLAGCGGSSGGDAQTQVTAPAYNGYPAITIPVTTGSTARCRHEADAFSREAVKFLVPYPSDSDTHLVIARVQFIAFKAHQCDTDLLRQAVARRLSAKQVREVLRFFGFMGETARELQPRPQY